MKGEIDKPTTIVGHFSFSLSIIHRSSRQKIKKDIADLNSTINKNNLIDIYRILHPQTEEYTFFSSSIAIFTKKTFWAINIP